MQTRIPFIKPKFPEPEALAEDLRRIYNNNYYSNNGPVYFEFKEGIEKYLGQGIHAVVVANATLGLMLAMYAVFGEAGTGKKFIATPSFTFAAGPLAVRWCGFEPVFYDIGKDVQPSIDSLKEVIRQHGRELAGVLLTNNFGIGNANIDRWESLLREAGIPFIIDSAPGFGSSYPNGQLIGGSGSCEIFSFHATKPFGIGEGGLITTRDTRLAERLESLKNFGFDKEKRTIGLGINAKITELDCAIGLRILHKYEAVLKDRRRSYLYYEDCLKTSGVSFLDRAATAAIQFATILVDTADRRRRILEALKSAGVEARTYYAPAVHTFPFFTGAPQVELTNTEDISNKVISLPVHPDMSKATIKHICSIIFKQYE